MTARRRNRPAAWLGLFAMLMLFVGPLLSQGLVETPVPSAHMAHAGHGDHAAHDPHAGHGAGAMHEPHDALWAKCGYCTLLFSCPALSQAPVDPAPPSYGLATPCPPSPASQGHPRAAFFPGARSRAPPLSA